MWWLVLAALVVGFVVCLYWGVAALWDLVGVLLDGAAEWERSAFADTET
jgi:hypothetical protein